jgi:hypothetical protein
MSRWTVARDAVAAGDLTQALPLATLAVDGFPVNLEGLPADMAAFEPGPPHAGADPLDDQRSLQLSDRADDDYDGPAQRAGRVDLFTEADELDVQPVKLVQYLEEVPGRACGAIAGPDQDHIEAAAACIAHHLVQSGAAGLRPGDPVGVLQEDFVTR